MDSQVGMRPAARFTANSPCNNQLLRYLLAGAINLVAELELTRFRGRFTAWADQVST